MRAIAADTDVFSATLRSLGVNSTAEIGSNARLRPFAMRFPLLTSPLAAGASTQLQMQVEGSLAFAAVAGVGRVWLATGGVVGTSIAGTPLIDSADPSPPATVGNIMPADHLVTVRLQTGDDFYNNNPIPFPFMFGRAFNANEAAFYPMPIGFAPRQTIILEVTNGTAQNIQLSAAFWGIRLPAAPTR